MKKYQIYARKHFIEKFNLGIDTPYLEVAKKVIEESNGRFLFDDYTKQGAAEFLARVRDRHATR